MKRKLKIILFSILLVAALVAFAFYRILFKVNTYPQPDRPLYIESGSDYAKVLNALEEHYLIDKLSFDKVAQRMNLPNTLKPGKYLLNKGLSNVQLVRKLRSGDWESETVKIKGETSRDSLTSYLGGVLEADKAILDSLLKSDWVTEHGFTFENVYCIFLPDHYHFNWATDELAVLERFYKEYSKFWNKNRLGKAYAKDLSAEEACILATIVDGEAIHQEEMPTIAGLYLNRLSKGMRLQADPTVMYFVRQEGRQRVLNKDIERIHPYNTYAIDGLPPGPISLADKRAIAAVLDAEDNDYIYMCAKEDGSFYHYFTASYRQHQINANKYRNTLNRQQIYR